MSLNGDHAAMELLSAHYDARGGRFVAGAQDNSVQVCDLSLCLMGLTWYFDGFELMFDGFDSIF